MSGARIERHVGGPESCERFSFRSGGFGPCRREARFWIVTVPAVRGHRREHRVRACTLCAKRYAEAVGLALPGEATLFEKGSPV